ncbi:MAG: CYTH domain-containing protein [bacterium]
MEIELEKTFLLKNIPAGLEKCKSIEIIDIYIPKSVRHPVLRIRKRGDIYEMTKKYPLVGKDSSEQGEYTISLAKEEFEELFKIKGKRFRKIRYFYPFNGKTAEIDLYLDDLRGLGVVDFEFNSRQEKNNFKAPDFCLVDVTQDEIFAGGLLAGKKYSDLEPFLKKYNYKKIIKI